MRESRKKLDIDLTDSELELFDKIAFDWKSHDELRDSLNPMCRLTESLLERRAIPEVRLQYFVDPERNPSGRGKSREQIFGKNGTTGDDILRHPHFLKYLQYFLFGPNLPAGIIQEFRDTAALSDHLSGHDVFDLIPKAKAVIRSKRLDPKDSAEEFYKLALECGAIPSSAAKIRQSLRVIKVRK